MKPAERGRAPAGTVAALLIAVAVLWCGVARADGLDVQFVSQTPGNVVPRGQATIAYQIQTSNIVAGGAATTIGVGINISVDGSTISASSGQFTSSGCTVDRNLSNSWACNNLGEGRSQTPTFTWNAPRPGSHTIRFTGFCQIIPVPSTGFVPCTRSNSASVTTVMDNNPPNGVIDSPSGNVTISAGSAVNFTGTGSDPDGDTPLRYSWNFGGGATGSSAEDPGQVTFNTAGTYTVIFTVTDSNGTPDPTPASVLVTVTAPLPTVSVSANPTAVNLGSSTQITWTASNATSCSAEGSWTGSKAATGGTETVTPTGSSATYGVRCTGPGGTAFSQATVQVNAVCGDGVVSGAETCDLAAANGSASSCCSSNCTLRAAGTVCRAAAGQCDVAEMCNGTAPGCPANGFAGTTVACSDGNACTTGDLCNGAGACVSGTAMTCDDGLFCNGKESCDPASGCKAGTAPTVNDGVACTTDSCDETRDVVVHATNNASCDDRLWCNGTETCDAAQGCKNGTAPALSDSVACTDDTCDEAGDKIVHTANDGKCDDALFCNGTEKCDAVRGCLAGAAPVVDDGVACTVDACDEASKKVVHPANDGKCDDGLFCNGAEKCDAARDCQKGAAPVTDDGVACTDDACDEASKKVVHTANDGKCDDGLFCNGAEKCDAARDCQKGAAPFVDDGVACTADACDETTSAVLHTPDAKRCDDGRSCNGAESCDSKKGCLPGGLDGCNRKPVGQSCKDGTGCESGFCIDAVCCAAKCEGSCVACTAALTGGEDGDCAPVTAGTDPKKGCDDKGESSCGFDGACDGAGACRYYASGTTCSTDLCKMPAVQDTPDTCDGQGHCLERGPVPCMSGYACVGFACKDSCTGDADCIATHYCVDSKCIPDQSRGSACTEDGHCQSNHCVDGVCCDTACAGTCRACAAAIKGSGADGICEPISADTDPEDECDEDGRNCGAPGTCDGAGTCRRNAIETTPCGATMCSDAVVSGSLCNGVGACGETSASCGSYQCSGDACATECTKHSECAKDAFCNAASKCVSLLDPGASCTVGAQCASGFCTDGFCCNVVCDGQCEACDAEGTRGKCAAVAGEPHGDRASCDGGHTVCAGSCDGKNRKECSYPDNLVSCGADRCRNGALSAQVCDGKGTCGDGETQDCAPYACDASGCRTTCSVDGDCVTDSTCQTGVCSDLPRSARCVDESTLMKDTGDTASCFPFRCRDARCLDECMSADDCIVGRECERSKCVEETVLPKKSADDGCGCRTPPRGTARDPVSVLLALAACVAAVRRRTRRRFP